jgi:5-methylcytosine-specific restriction endonuclease McrA
MGSIIREAFKYDRAKNAAGATAARGTCYVPQFNPSVRSDWVEKVMQKWTGKCHYTGLDIEIGSTASLDHCIPVSRAAVFGPSLVYSPENLVWCHKAVNTLKGEMTEDEFRWWLKNQFIPTIEALDRQA